MFGVRAPQDPITGAFAVSTIARDRCPLDPLPSCSRLRTSSLRRWRDGTGGSCPAEQHWPALLNRTWYGGFDPLGYSVLSPPVMALPGVFCFKLSGRPVVRA